MKYNNEDIVLSNGTTMPRVAFGTWRMWRRRDAGMIPTTAALKSGCRYIDTAKAYHTEIGVGMAIRQSRINRSNVFISTKLNPDRIRDGNAVWGEIYESKMHMFTDYIDCVFIHAPATWDGEINDNISIYKALEESYKKGEIRNIGLSNFSIEQIQEILNVCEIPPTVIQMPLSIGYVDKELLYFCKQHGIQPIAYSPIASGYLLDSPIVVQMAEKYGVEPAQVCLDFAGQLCGAYAFGSEDPEHIATNLATEQLLTPEDMDTLLQIKDDRRMWDFKKGWMKSPEREK